MNQQVQELIQQYWHGGLDQRLPVIVSILAIALLSYSLASLSWRLLPMPGMDPVVRLSSTQQRQAQRSSVRKDAPVAQKIRQWSLFGEVEKEAPKTEVVVPEVIPVSKSNLKLRGVFASKIAANARAIIADKNIDESYKIGSQLPGGAILTEIYEDRVIIESNGRLETLLLPDADSGDGGRGGSQPSSAARRTTAREAVLTSSQDVMNASKNITDNAALLRTYKEALLSNPNSMMGLVNIRPYQKDGRLVGYRIRPGRDRGLLKRFGLRSGDIVTSVNGIGLDNPVKALEVLRDLSSATNLTLGVERNGASQSFSFSIE